MISDQQRGLLGQSLPTGRLEPEVVLVDGIPDRHLSAHQSLVGAFEGMFGSGRDTLGDQALDSAWGLALGAPGLGRGTRLERRPAAALVPSRCAREAAREDR